MNLEKSHHTIHKLNKMVSFLWLSIWFMSAKYYILRKSMKWLHLQGFIPQIKLSIESYFLVCVRGVELENYINQNYLTSTSNYKAHPLYFESIFQTLILSTLYFTSVYTFLICTYLLTFYGNWKSNWEKNWRPTITE